MLQALGLPQPKAIVSHGWWVVEGQKLSKSRGPKVQPLDLADVYGADAFRYFLVRDAALDRDAEFSRERIENRYQGDLANDLGNLLHRLVHMVGRYCNGRMASARGRDGRRGGTARPLPGPGARGVRRG